MFYLVSKELPYKVINIAISKEKAAFRILTPTLVTEASVDSKCLLFTNSVLGSNFFIKETTYCCQHECILDKKDAIWKPGNHLVVYTTSDLFINKTLAIGLKESICNIPNVTIIAEILCSDSDRYIFESDFVFITDPAGILFTNVQKEFFNQVDEPFGFKTYFTGPKSIKKNEAFKITMGMYSYSGEPVTGTVVIKNLSGYIPDRRIKIINGIGNIDCYPLLLNSSMRIEFNNSYFEVEVKDG